MKSTLIPTLLFLLLFSICANSQPGFPAPGQLYRPDVVPRVDILIHPDSLAWIYANVESEHEFRATFVFDNGNVHDTIHDIGFRLRGNTSRYAPKKSFKVSFNTYIAGRKYHGVEKLNLNGEHNDPSVIRARICWDIFNQSRLPAPRSNHVQVFINQNYYGCYINVEHIDENFVKTRFGNNDGDLYKCLYPADLNYLGSNPDSYKLESGGRRVYDLKIQKNDDYTKLADFINILNNTPLSQLPCELEKVFNVQDYLKTAAVDVLTANWDGYIYNKNNFYLYLNTSSGLFEYIPYDVDNTFGIDWFSINWSVRNVYSWAPSATSEKRPLYNRLMQVPEYKAAYTFYLKQAINQFTGTLALVDSINHIKSMISPYVSSDPYYPLTYGFSMSSFNNSYTMALGQHVPIGLFPFISNRNSSALAQAISANIAPVIKYIRHNQARPNQQINITAHVEDELPMPVVVLEYRINGGPWLAQPMQDDGMSGDGQDDDKTYGVFLDGLDAGTTFEFRIRANDAGNNFNMRPCEPITWIIIQPTNPPLFVNEFMASNSNIIADEFGEYDDWIEIYNAGDQPVWLGDKYLSDNLNNPTKWAFPDTTIAAKGFLLVWADGQSWQGGMHATYKLDKDGEEIGIFNNLESAFSLIDSCVFGLQSNNISMGRVEDGADDWVFFSTPTPGRSNHITGLRSLAGEDGTLIFSPNPVTDGVIYFRKPLSFRIMDLPGHIMQTYINTDKADVSALKDGIYILQGSNGSHAKLIISGSK